jgi:hypothetical protein
MTAHLMANDKDITLSLQLHDDWFKANNDVSVRFTPSVSIIEFILVSTLVVFRVFLL